MPRDLDAELAWEVGHDGTTSSVVIILWWPAPQNSMQSTSYVPGVSNVWTIFCVSPEMTWAWNCRIAVPVDTEAVTHVTGRREELDGHARLDLGRRDRPGELDAGDVARLACSAPALSPYGT